MSRPEPGLQVPIGQDTEGAPASGPSPSLLRAPRCIAIMPALNEQDSIFSVIAEIRASCPTFEIVVVDDHSTDRTAAVASEAAVHVLRLPFNLGIGGAVQTGYRYALERGFDIAVQVDADGQHDPKEIPRLLAPIVEGRADVVIGSRFVHGGCAQAGRLRRLAMRGFSWTVSAVVRQRVLDTSSSFRALNRRAISFCSEEYPQGFLETIEATVLLARHGSRIVEIPVAMRPRTAGQSSLDPIRAAVYAAKVLLAVLVSLFRRPTSDWEEG